MFAEKPIERGGNDILNRVCRGTRALRRISRKEIRAVVDEIADPIL